MKQPSHQLRIIGGQWRSRRISFAALPHLRPTPDSVRETLFNWLAPVIHGARCLDLFVGSGALGIEAASRGAKNVVLVDSEPKVIRHVEAQLATLTDDAMLFSLVNTDARAYLAGPPTPFDIVFIDPPYAETELVADCCELLEAGGWLTAAALIYLETPARQGKPILPANWILRRSKRMGQVGFHLAANSQNATPINPTQK